MYLGVAIIIDCNSSEFIHQTKHNRCYRRIMSEVEMFAGCLVEDGIDAMFATCGRRMDALVNGLFVSRWGLAAVGRFEMGFSCRGFYHGV